MAPASLNSDRILTEVDRAASRICRRQHTIRRVWSPFPAIVFRPVQLRSILVPSRRPPSRDARPGHKEGDVVPKQCAPSRENGSLRCHTPRPLVGICRHGTRLRIVRRERSEHPLLLEQRRTGHQSDAMRVRELLLGERGDLLPLVAPRIRPSSPRSVASNSDCELRSTPGTSGL